MSVRAVIARAHARFVTQYAGWIVALAVLGSIAVFPYAARLKLKANYLDLLPPNFESVKHLDALTKELGGTSFLVVAAESKNKKAADEAAARFTEKAASFRDLDFVDERTDVSSFENYKLLFLTPDGLQTLKQKVLDVIGYYRRKNNPFFVDLLREEPPAVRLNDFQLEEEIHRVASFAEYSKDTFLRVLLLKPKHPISDFASSERLFNDCAAAFAEINRELDGVIDFGLTGPYQTRYDEYRVIKQDLKFTSLITLILVSALMFLFFKNKRLVLFAFAPLAIGVLWTAAFAEFAIGYLNLISAFLLSILFALGISFAIHLLIHFREASKTAANITDAFENTFSEVSAPSLSSALTTSVAFLSLTISTFEGFRHFGLIAGVGIMICFLSVFFILPSLITLFEKWFPLQSKFEWPLSKWLILNPWIVYGVLIGGIVFTGFSAAQIPKAKFEYDFGQLQNDRMPSIRLGERIGEHLGVVLNPVVLAAPNRARAGEAAGRINAYIASHPETAFHFATSLASYVPPHQEEKIRILREIDQILASRSRYLTGLSPDLQAQMDDLKRWLKTGPIGFKDIPQGFREQYEGKNGAISVVFVYPKRSLLDGRAAKQFVAELRSLDLPEDTVLTGEPVLYADILLLLERDTPRAILLSLGLVLTLLVLHFRRASYVLWALAPVVLGLVWLTGLMSLLGFKFNYFNVAILPSILGVGIDNGIHIFHRYKIEGHVTVFEIMRRTGKAVFLASMTNIIAFASIGFARHRGMASMGELGTLGFASCMLASAVFLPVLIEFFETRYWKRPKPAPEGSNSLTSADPGPAPETFQEDPIRS